MANNSYICNQCGEIFKTKANLKSHQTRSKYCKILTKAIIICKTCHKKFDNLKLLDQHICVEDGSNNLSYTNDMINKLQIINEHYKKIIEDNISIKLPDVIQDTDQSNPKTPPTSKIRKKSKDESTKNIKIIEKPKKKEIENSWPDFNTINQNIIVLLESLKTDRNYNKTLINIKNNRKKMLRYLSIVEYKNFFDDNIKKIKDNLIEKFNDVKKVEKVLKKSICSLETRLLILDDIEKTNIEIDDLKLLEETIILKNDKNKLEPFNQTIFISKFLDYYISLIDIKKLLTIFLCQNKFNNIIYIEHKPSIKNPYSFYYLDCIKGDKKYWKMDCRLDELVKYFSVNVKEHCVKLFRNLYTKIYHDNDWRENWLEYEIFEIEGKQLISTILILSDIYKLSVLMFEILMEHNKYDKTDNDVFNLMSDDNLLKKEWIQLSKKKNIESPLSTLKLLFDNIEDEQLKQLNDML